MVVKVGGMCCVMSTGARSITLPSEARMVPSACGPPVDAPISKTRGALAAIGRSLISAGGCSACSAWTLPSGVGPSTVKGLRPAQPGRPGSARMERICGHAGASR